MNDPKQSREGYDDLDPTDEKAKQITGGDTAGADAVVAHWRLLSATCSWINS